MLSCVPRMKELELEDRQYEVDKELNELCQVPRKLLMYIVYTLYLMIEGLWQHEQTINSQSKNTGGSKSFVNLS